MSSWSTGYGDFVMKPDLDTLRPVPVARAARRCAWPTSLWQDGSPTSSPRRARSCARQLDRLAERGWTALAGHRARVHRLPRHLRGGVAQGLPRPRARPTTTTSTTRSSARRGVEPLIGPDPATRWPAPACEVENSKGECNFGQHEINFRYEDALGAADTHAIYKNGAKEIAAAGGDGDHVHGQVRRARGQLVPHPPLAARRRRRAGVRRPARGVRALPGRPARLPARADAVPGAEHQLLQALRGGLVRPHRGRLGPRQPHVLDARRRPRAVAADGEPRRRAATSTPTSRSRR